MSAQNASKSSSKKTTAVVPHRELGAPEPVFDPSVVNACDTFVEDYRSSKIPKSVATLRIMRAIHDKPSAEITIDQRNLAFSNYFEMLEEHDRSSREATERANEPSSLTASGAHEHTSEDEEEEDYEPSESDVTVPAKRKPVDLDERLESSGRRKIDEAIIPFASIDTSSTLGLGVDLRETLRLKENYTRNLEAAKQIAISSPVVPEFPQALWKDVLANNFVDLDKVLSGEYTITGDPRVIEKFGETGLSISSGEQKPSRAVTNHGEWTIAWRSYKRAVIFAYPHRGDELNDYADEINRLFGSVQFPLADRVIQFDKAVRSRAARSNRLLLSDGAAFYDLSIRHITSAGASVGQSSQKAQASGGRSNDICRRFNDGLCASRSCRFKHACFACRSREHGAHACNKASGSQTRDVRK